ncbi:trans-aconitate 2-methyltransferase [Cyanobium sp. WAJ14-Wanaka]|uniref:class I SAM-dependent methyltransferase n=1 Tax=Cyanobium sp. WAJ14-Wanaka TaxID=2823725 RepID=UPI0020CD057A|nr:class I SAM-dependent methyltransferase [Cyanobium sp. WAJ14-Wanaka]MCP9774374.1 methyltransferase domain-containing protein [Cyanobium sp. WAJ14-Wanaka]
MQRTCEPELMDDRQQALAYGAADFASSDQAFVDRLADFFPGGLGDRLVDLGCGPGNISFRLAERFASASVLAVDGAGAMLELGRQALAAIPAERAGRIQFVQAVLPDPALPGGFSGLLSNSLLHHLHDPQVLWRALGQLGCPGAAVYVKDLRRPASPEAALALQELHLGQLDGTGAALLRRDYLASLHAAFTAEEVRTQLREAGLVGLQVAELGDRYLEVWGRLAGWSDDQPVQP